MNGENNPRSKMFSQVTRTSATSGNADGTNDILDPLSLFAMENIYKESAASQTPPSNRTSVKSFASSLGLPKFDTKFLFQSDNSPKSGKDDNVIQNTSKYSSTANTKPIETKSNDDEKPDLEDAIKFLTGEQKIMSLVDASLQTTPGHFISGALFMTNYRIAFIPRQSDLRDMCAINPSLHSWLQIPLSCIDRLDREKKPKESVTSSTINIVIVCKDFRQHRITIKSKNSSNGDYDIERAFSVLTAYAFPNNMRYLFAFSHSLTLGGQPVKLVDQYDCMEEFSRLGVLDSGLWRLCRANSEFKLCNTYPPLLFVPQGVTDEELHIVSNFRSGHRLPVLCWANKETGVSMWRSSQPKAGVSGSCMQDEKLLDMLARSCFHTASKRHPPSREPLLHIIDLRSRASAMANRAAGAGYESQTNYPTSRLEFYNIPNIHGVRESFKALAAITLNPAANAANDVNFSKQIEDTNWLTNLRLVLKASWEAAMFLSKGHPVLVHCSHGWDRTAQVCALAQLLLDPFYRTMDGFKVLVEKEWVSFGHPFQMRCGHSQDKQTRQEDQISPILLQFLDCVWQIQKQHCQYFEFNSRYLLAIADHIYSGRFGTFLFSNDYDRDLYNSRQQCADIWTYLHCSRNVLLNPMYMHSVSTSGLVASLPITANKFCNLLPPLTQLLRNVTLWSDYYLRWSSVPSSLSAPTVLSKQLYSNGLCRPLYFPPNDTAFTGEVETVGVSGKTLSTSSLGDAAKNITAKSSTGDLDLMSIVTSDDFWEGAYRLEREARIKSEESLSKFKTSQQVMLNSLRSFLFERAVDMSEEELNALLDMHLDVAPGSSPTSDPAVELLDPATVDVMENLLETEDTPAEDDFLSNDRETDGAGGRSSLEDADVFSAEEEADYEAGRYSPLPTAVKSAASQQPSFLV